MSQYTARIVDYKLLPLQPQENKYALNVWVRIPKTQEEALLEEKGSLETLENKYQFVKNMRFRDISRILGKTCLVEKNEDGSYQFVSYMALTAAQ